MVVCLFANEKHTPHDASQGGVMMTGASAEGDHDGDDNDDDDD